MEIPSLNPHAVLLTVPQEKILCVGQTMEDPYLVKATHLTHILEVRIETWLDPNPEMPELIMTLLLPNEVNRILRLIRQAYMTTLPFIPVSMIDRLPPIANDTFPITCMVWNVQGAGSRAFSLALKELIRIHRPVVLVLVETHMGGAQALKIASMLGYSGHTRVDATGFSGGIWVYWKKELVTVEPISQQAQYITMDIKRLGSPPWYFTAVYASPDPNKRKDLWQELQAFAATHNHPWLVAGDFNDTRYDWERNSACSETKRR